MPAASAADPTPRNPRRENMSFLESLFASSLVASSLSLSGSSLFGSKLIKSFLGLFLRNQQHRTSRLRLPSRAKRYGRHTLVSIFCGPVLRACFVGLQTLLRASHAGC